MKFDKKTIKVLSVETRVEILKQLRERQKMPSELSGALGKSKSTISEHLSILAEAGLVAKSYRGKKWIYYSLTDKGKSVISERPVETVIILSLAALSMLGGLYNISSFYSPGYAETAQRAVAEAAPAAVPAAQNFAQLYLGAALVVISLGLLIYYKKFYVV